MKKSIFFLMFLFVFLFAQSQTQAQVIRPNEEKTINFKKNRNLWQTFTYDLVRTVAVAI